MKVKRKVSTTLGETLAHVQDTVDQVVSFGFKKLKESGKKKPKKDDSEVKKTLQKTAGFLGEVGTAFYKKYEEIKEKPRKNKKSANK